MGTTYQNAVGAPPVCTSRAWQTWYKNLLAYRLAECPIARATTYYFSQRGSDSTGDGSNGYIFGSLSSGNYAAGTLTFTGSPFSTYTFVEGDTINITGGTGVTAGSYLITGKTDANNLTVSYRVSADGITSTGTTLPTVSDSSITVTGGWWKTIAKMQTVLDASSGNICIRLKRGEVWRETFAASRAIASGGATTTLQMAASTSIDGYTYPSDIPVGAYVTLTGGTTETLTRTVVSNAPTTGVCVISGTNGTTHTAVTWTQPAYLNITKDNVTITDFGPNINGRKATITAWQAAWNVTAGGCTKTAGRVFTYQIDSTIANNTVSWVREENDVVKPYRLMSSIAEVDDVAGSWWQDTATLITYIHPHGNQALKTVGGSFSSAGHAYQFIYNQNVPAIYLNSVNGTRISNIRIDGYGCSTSANVVPQTYGIKGSIGSTQCAVVSDCEVYYNYLHNIGILCGTTGSIVSYVRCVYGWGSLNGDLANYATGGGQEAIIHQCECRGSTLPIGYHYNATGNSGSPNICHSTYVQITSSNWSGNTITITNAGGGANGQNVSSIALAAGRTIQLDGGTAQVMTIQSYNANTGILTFTGSMNGTTHTTCHLLIYECSLYIIYQCNVDRGPSMASNFKGPANGKSFTDLADCRTWVVGCEYVKRNCLEDDKGYKFVTLSSAVQAGTSATLTTPIGTANLGANTNTDMLMGGGTELPEWVRVQSYANSTGVMTLAAGTPIQGAARTWIRVPTTSAASLSASTTLAMSGSDFSTSTEGSGLYDVVFINCRMECGGLYSQLPGGTTVPFTNAGSFQGAYWINCTILFDNSEVTTANGQTSLALMTGSGAYAKFYNCMFYFRFTGRYVLGMETTATAAAGTATNITVMNCIIAFDSNQNQTVLDLTQANNTGTLASLGLGNSATLQKHNALYGVTQKTGTWGYSNNPNTVLLMGIPPVDFEPDSDSPLVDANNELIDGIYLLGIDRYNNPRSTTPAIGPLEPLQGASSGGGLTPFQSPVFGGV